MKYMKQLAPLTLPSTANTRVWHGGNDYRGPGAWKRPRRSKRAGAGVVPLSAMKEPLDLTMILDQGENRGKGGRGKGQRSRQRRKNYRLLASRLESLSLERAPSYGGGGGDPPDVRWAPSAMNPEGQELTAEGAHSRQRAQDGSPPRGIPRQQCFNSRTILPNIVDKGGGSPDELMSPMLLRQVAQQRDVISNQDVPRRPAAESDNAVTVGATQPIDQALMQQQASGSRGTPIQFCSKNGNTSSELRAPTALVKMAVDDNCNAQADDARSKLRAILEQQRSLLESVRQRRLDVRLKGIGGKTFGARKPHYSPGEPRAQKSRCANVQGKNARGKDATPNGEGLSRARIHPLLFMAETELRRVEQHHLGLEDAEAVHLSKFEEARQRKEDYAKYYDLTLRYGPLSDKDFDMAVYPGRVYVGIISDAAHVVQNWWWSTWPPVLRRRKSAALAVQSAFRGFVKRRQYQGIVRLRTLWGTTRIVAHVFVSWRDQTAKVRRVAAFTNRFRKLCVVRCLQAWRRHVDTEREAREDVVRQRLRRAKDGIRARVFENWVIYTETSLAVDRMRRRVILRPMLRAWSRRALADRVRNRMFWACAKLASRALRYHGRRRFVEAREACCKMQSFARRVVGRAKVQREMAKDIIQAVEDERLSALVEKEQARRDRLQEVMDAQALRFEDRANAFLQTPAGKSAVKEILSGRKATGVRQKTSSALPERILGSSPIAAVRPKAIAESEVRKRIVHQFTVREKAALRHDFNAEWPPPFRCPRADCQATFVDPSHCARHAADAHPEDAPGVAELGVVFSESAGLSTFEDYLSMVSSGRDVHPGEKQETAESMSCAAFKHEWEDVRRNLELLKAISRWRTVSSASSSYKQLTAAAYTLTIPVDLDEATENLNRGQERDGGGGRSTVLSSCRWGEANRCERASDNEASDDNETEGCDCAIAAVVLEKAGWRALVDVHGTAIGRGFLASAPYLQYLESVEKPVREAVMATVTDIISRKHAERLEEARALRAAAICCNNEAAIDALAEETLAAVLEEGKGSKGGDGVLGSTLDDLAALLAVVIMAERSAFTKVISAVWKEVVDMAARQHAREQCQVTPGVAEAVAEAVCSISRSVVMDELIDECASELTRPGGAFWPDERAAAAVADGVVYRVRCNIMTEMMDTSLVELSRSGEAERLMLQAPTAQTEGGTTSDTSEQKGQLVATDDSVAEAVGGGGTDGWTGEVELHESDDGMGSDLPETENDDTVDNAETMRTLAMTSVSEERATVRIQSVLRRKAVYRETKRLIARTFLKLYDPVHHSVYWYNQASGESTWDKPAIIDFYFKKAGSDGGQAIRATDYDGYSDGTTSGVMTT